MDYLIPANAKKGTLIFGIFNKFDLILASTGAAITILVFIIISPDTFTKAIISLAPLLIAAFLVTPIPNYHNVLTLLKEIIDFFYGRRNYKWEGWCYKDEYK